MRQNTLLLSLAGLLLFSIPSYSQMEFKDSLDILELTFQEYTGRSLKVDHYTIIPISQELHDQYYQPLDSTTVPGISFYSGFIEDDTLEVVSIFVIAKREKDWVEFLVDLETEVEAKNIKIQSGGADHPSLFLIEYSSHHYFTRGEEKRNILEIWDVQTPKRLAKIDLEKSGYGSFLDVEKGITTLQKIDYKGRFQYKNGTITFTEEEHLESKIEIDSNLVEKTIYNRDGKNKLISFTLENGYFIRQ